MIRSKVYAITINGQHQGRNCLYANTQVRIEILSNFDKISKRTSICDDVEILLQIGQDLNSYRRQTRLHEISLGLTLIIALKGHKT